jgi:hypothetical protein
MKKKKALGGKREGAGRRKIPVELKREPLTVYARKIDLDRIGRDEAKRIALQAIEEVTASSQSDTGL